MATATAQPSQAAIFAEDLFPFSLRIGSSSEEMHARFDEFARNNPSLKLEQTADGEIVVMLPTGGKSGIRGTEITRQVANWAIAAGGLVFDSATLFKLPSGAKRGPDCAWVRKERWDSLSDDEQEAYPPLAPDLAIELRSKTDRLSLLQAKMMEYVECGVSLGWLIDPYERVVYVYQPEHAVIELRDPKFLEGGAVAIGLTLDLATIFETPR